MQQRELNRIASLLESLIDANDQADRIAFETRRETLANVRQLRLQLDRIEEMIAGGSDGDPSDEAKPHSETALQHLAAGNVPVEWFTKSALWFGKKVLPHLLTAGGAWWAAHAHLFG